jgi:hypothetical protein
MKHSIEFMDLADKINPLAFVKYLKDTGWIEFPTKKSYINIFQIRTEDDGDFQVKIPLDQTLLDYKEAMLQAVEIVAAREHQTMEQLLLYLLNPNTDIIKVRLERDDVEAGTILFDDAIRIYENAKKLITATAQDVLHPKYYHQGRMEEVISKFIGSCKFGQTELGSYIVSIVCPFAELDDSAGYRQLSIFSEEEECARSLTRQVTNRIMSNIYAIKNHIDEGDYSKLISEDQNSMISANFYEALSGLNLEVEGSHVEFIARWAPAVKTNRSLASRVMLTHDYYQPIAATVGKLRETTNQKTKIVGRIKKLEAVPDITKRTSGKVTIVYLDEADNKKIVTANLDKEDYDIATVAHTKGNHVEIVGELTQTGSRTASISCESFGMIN